MTEFVIIKATRNLTRHGYSGPSCEAAGVMPGKIYDNIEEAEADARKLALVNPVGFVVYERPFEPELYKK